MNLVGLVVVSSLLGQSTGLEAAKTRWSDYGLRHGFKVAGSYHQEANVKDWNVVAAPVQAQSLSHANSLWPVFKAEFSKYPVCFIKKSGLKEVDFVSTLSVAGQPRGAMPDYVNDRLVLDVNLSKQPEWYIRHVIHHEFYHLVENRFHGDPYFKDPSWAKLNASEFNYGQGGAKMRDARVTPLIHPQKGFVNIYSTSGLEEDKAEVWAVMFCKQDWDTIQPWLADDSVLMSKVKFLEAFASKACPDMSAAFWKRTRKA